MSRAGREVAYRYGENLPAYPDLATATAALLKEKDRLVNLIVKRAGRTSPDLVDFSVESLLRVEKWYFEQQSSGGIFKFLHPFPAETMARAIAFYFGEVVVRNLEGAEWVIDEFAFTSGKYTIGVRRGLITMALTSFSRKLHHELNKKRNSVWRTYQCNFALNPKVRINF